MNEIALEVRNLTKRFPAATGLLGRRSSVHAVDDVSFSLRRGAITALVGESGSGKSTVARLLVRLYDPTSGTILFGDHDVARDRSKRSILRYRSQVQMIFQDPFGSLNPAKTILHHIERPLRIHGIVESDQIEERAHELLRTVGLVPPEHIAKKYPHELSGGQRQRVAIARTLAVEPGGPARRRADEHARRLDPDRDPELDAEAQGGAPRSRSSTSRTTSRARATSPTTSSSCTRGRSSSRGRSSRCSPIRSIRTRSCCSRPSPTRDAASRRSASRSARASRPPQSTRPTAAASSPLPDRDRRLLARHAARSSRRGRARPPAATSPRPAPVTVFERIT